MSFDVSLVVAALPKVVAAGGLSLTIAFAALAVGLTGAVLMTLLRAAKIPPLSRAIAVLRSIVFGTPTLIVIFMAYYTLPAIGVNLTPWTAGVLAIGTVSAFFMSEVMRGCLSTIGAGQVEAATALGLRAVPIWLRVLLPQLLRAMLPHLVNEFTIVVKATALLSAITVTELLRTAQQIYAVNYRPLETLVAAGVLYATVNIAAGRIGARLETSGPGRAG